MMWLLSVDGQARNVTHRALAANVKVDSRTGLFDRIAVIAFVTVCASVTALV